MATNRTAWVGVDLGGTSMMAAVIDVETGRVLGEAKRRTKRELGATAVTERLAGAIRKAVKRAGLRQKDVRGVGIGIPGPVDPTQGRVVRCVNLGATWDNFGLQEVLERLTNLKVTIDNDVNVGAVGEHRFGAGRGADDIVTMFVGTGIGGGLVLDGKLRTGFRYSAGEVGHMVLMDGGPLCGCGERGHAEALASRTAIERYIGEGRAAQAGIEPAAVAEDQEQITSGDLLSAVEEGDEIVQAALAKAQHYLGLMIANCVNIIDPEVVVIGGGVLEKMGDAYLDPVRAVAQQHFINKDNIETVRIVRAELGDYSGVIGAAALASQRLD